MSTRKRKIEITDIINSYKNGNTPYVRRSNYKKYLSILAEEIKHTRGSFIGEVPCISYVYVYLNPLKSGKYVYICPSGKIVKFSCEPFYVGKGIHKRKHHHEKEARRNIASHKANTIRSIWKEGREPLIKSTSTPLTDYLALAFEIDLIAGIGRSDKNQGPLTNLTDGDDGISGVAKEAGAKISKALKGIPHSLERRKAKSESMLGTVNLLSRGLKRTSEAKLKMSLAKIGKSRPKFTDKTREKMSASSKGVPKSKQHKMSISKSQNAIPHVTCPHCNFTGRPANLGRWHFDNCKMRE